MSAGPVTLFSLSVAATLAIMCAALVLLVLWQDAHHRRSRYFALCLTIFGLYAVINLPLQAASFFDLDPRMLVHRAALLYVLGIVLLFNFVLVFAGVPPRIRRAERAFILPLGAVFAYLALRHMLFEDFTPTGTGAHGYHMTRWGFAGAAILVLYTGALAYLLYRQRHPKAREIAVPTLLLGIGMLVFSATPNMREYSLNTITVILALYMIGHIVTKYQVFQPLADLNRTLAQKNDELLHATQAKAQFLANMSHELRTPLNSIIGYTELVTAGTYGDLTERQQDRLQKVTRNGRRLLELINDVLDLSKIEAGRVELHCTGVNTVDLLDSLLSDFEIEARVKGLALVRAYITLPDLHIDRERGRQILANLIANAIKFTEHGAVIVRGHADPARKQVVISVTDTGSGIEHAQQEHVFEAFQQAEGPAARAHEGSGLGLAIARRLTLLHGGSMWFESVVGQGTTFHVALPATDTQDSTPQPVVTPRRRGGGQVILVIDDDRDAVELLQDQLEAARYRVYGAYTAAAGLELAHTLHPALIMLDVNLPDIEGWQVLEILRRDPGTTTIPVVIVSAADLDSTAHSVGADGMIIKPIDAERLLAQVKSLLALTEAQAVSTPGPHAEAAP